MGAVAWSSSFLLAIAVMVSAILVSGRPAQAGDSLFDAFAEPYQSIRVAAAETGIVRKIHVRQGTQVKSGQLLAELDSEVVEAELATAKSRAANTGRVQAAIADLDLRQVRLNKIRSLHAEQSATPEELQRAEADVALATANLQTAKEDVALAQCQVRTIAAQLDRRMLRSPIDGVVVQIDKKQGEFSALTAPEFATVVQLDVLKTRFHVPAHQAQGLRLGEQLPLVFRDPQAETTAEVEFVAPLIDGDSGTIRVEVRIDNSAGKFRAGSRCRIVFDQTARAGASKPSSRQAQPGETHAHP